MEEGWRGVVNVRQEHVSQLRTFFHLEQISVTTNFDIVRAIRRIEYNNIDRGIIFIGLEGGANTNANGDLPAAILIAKTSYDDENRSGVVAHDKWESDYQLFLKDLQQDTKLIFSMRAALRNQNHPPLRPFVPLQDLLDG